MEESLTQLKNDHQTRASSIIEAMQGVVIATQWMHMELYVNGSSPMELVGVHPTRLLMKTKSNFEKAHHWNIQSKFYSVNSPYSYTNKT